MGQRWGVRDGGFDHRFNGILPFAMAAAAHACGVARRSLGRSILKACRIKRRIKRFRNRKGASLFAAS
jgi:hypothetical protein